MARYGRAVVGVIDGSNRLFTLEDTPDDKGVAIYYNGFRLYENQDYCFISSRNIHLTTAPVTGDRLLADYTNQV